LLCRHLLRGERRNASLPPNQRRWPTLVSLAAAFSRPAARCGRSLRGLKKRSRSQSDDPEIVHCDQRVPPSAYLHARKRMPYVLAEYQLIVAVFGCCSWRSIADWKSRSDEQLLCDLPHTLLPCLSIQSRYRKTIHFADGEPVMRSFVFVSCRADSPTVVAAPHCPPMAVGTRVHVPKKYNITRPCDAGHSLK
jgi:hypothetical protein